MPKGPNETKADAFKRLATARVRTAIKAVQLVGNLSNRSIYDYDSKQVMKIIKALQSEVDRAKAKFSESDSEDKGGFSL